MESFVDFVTRLIYGTGAEAVVTPNHSNWLSANPSPGGSAWIAHYLDALLPAYEAWLALNNLPPIVAWAGEDTRPWIAGLEYPLAGDPLDNPTTIASMDALGDAFIDRFNVIADTSIDRIEIRGLDKDPFSYRFWGYLKFADNIRRTYRGEVVIPATNMFDRDGTILSPIAFCDTFNILHANWHGSNSPVAQNSQPTPSFESSAGQNTSLGGIGMGNGEEFIKFHHDHVELFSRWLQRTDQPPVKPINMYNGNTGWPGSNTGNPSTWTMNDDSPWINTGNGDTDLELRAFTDVDDLGGTMSGTIHGSGHTRNSDITDINHNNYVPRFHAWHGWIDAQWYFRKPRFGFYDDVARQRVKVFAPVLFGSGADWPGMHALTIVRDPLVTNDVVAPANAIDAVNLSTGAGNLRMKLRVEDPYARQLTLRLKAEAFDDGASAIVEAIPEATHTYLVGSTGAGDDFDHNVNFTVDFAFTLAFLSDDPTRANPAVGFVANRIRVTGTLEPADGTDLPFAETETIDIDLLQEKQAPDVDLYFDLGSFGEDQVAAAQSLSGTGDGVFENALYVVVQDRTSDANPIDWAAHPNVLSQMQGLIQGFTPACGLFDDLAHAPTITLGSVTGGASLTGVRFEPVGPPVQEDSALAVNLPQRFTYAYNVVFEATNNAFDGLALGNQQFVTLDVSTYDRSGNQATQSGQIKLFRAANPFIRDGATSWLSIDTRVFHVLEGDTLFGETITDTTDPNAFVTSVLTKLDTNTGLGGDSFDTLPTNQASSALLPFDTVTDQTTGVSRVVHNFALAKVRLQGLAGAANVRAFFRLFRYSASNLVFDPATTYRTHDTAGGVKVPLLGFEAESPGSELVSVPFFAEPRVAVGANMQSQTDAPNAKDFPGTATEDVLYFGVYLDINQSDVRLPIEYVAAHPDGGFGAADPTQSLPTLMLDQHQCMVVEIKFDGDATTVGDTPAQSDNLAQRNLMILTTDNPGAALTHTVQHSFEVDLGKVRPPNAEPVNHIATPSKQRQALLSPRVSHLNFINTGDWHDLVKGKAIGRAMNTPGVMMSAWRQFVPAIEKELAQVNPLIFSHDNWRSTARWVDELMIRWNDIPRDARATIYLPGINCEQIVNLRSLRHAPGDIKIVDSHTLAVTTGDVSYLPLPPLRTDKLAGVITIELPEDIKRGQGWQVDVLQIRGGQAQVLGGFQIDIQVKVAAEIHANETRFLRHVFDQLSLLEPDHRWHPVLRRRVETMRARARALADSAGVEWHDPTGIEDPKQPGESLPFEGKKTRVVLEKIEILDDLDTFIKGAGEFVFSTEVFSANNGGVTQSHRFPEKGVMKVSDRDAHNCVSFDCPIFEGYVVDDLRIAISGTEKDLFDPNDTLGKYSRLFSGEIARHFGAYGPNGEPVEPEDLISWRVWYRIERG